jgi:hypothetical protein
VHLVNASDPDKWNALTDVEVTLRCRWGGRRFSRC